MTPQLEILEAKLDYRFDNRHILREALTHPSYAIERSLNYNNQRLEFLGDAVLDLVMSEYLFDLYSDASEGDLTKIRSALVCQETLARLARIWDLGPFMLLGKGEQLAEGGEFRDSLLSDMFESIIGGIFRDGGLEAVKTIVMPLYLENFPEPVKVLEKLNPKGALQELSQAKWGETPEYSVLAVSGPGHKPEYTVEVRLGKFAAVGRASSRKGAEMDAAGKLLQELQAN